MESDLKNFMDEIEFSTLEFLERLKKFEDILGKTGNVLDIGCGPGFFLRFAKKRGWKVSGIDSSLKAVNYAKKKLLHWLDI